MHGGTIHTTRLHAELRRRLNYRVRAQNGIHATGHPDRDNEPGTAEPRCNRTRRAQDANSDRATQGDGNPEADAKHPAEAALARRGGVVVIQEPFQIHK